MVFAAVNHLSGPLGNDRPSQKVTSVSYDGRFLSILFVSVFHGSLAVAINMTDSSENAIVSWILNFRVRISLKTAITVLICFFF